MKQRNIIKGGYYPLLYYVSDTDFQELQESHFTLYLNALPSLSDAICNINLVLPATSMTPLANGFDKSPLAISAWNH